MTLRVSARDLFPGWSLVTVLLFAIGLRILFAPGVGYEGSFDIIEEASALASDLKPFNLGHLSTLPKILGNLTEDFGLPRLIAIVPVALAYSILGETDFITRALGLISSVASMILIYLIAKKLIDAETAILSVILYALIPLDIFYSGTLTRFTFLLPLTLFSAYHAVQFSQRKTAFVALAVAIGTILLIVAEFWLALFLVLLWICTLGEKVKPGIGILFAGISAGVGLFACMLVYWQDLSNWRVPLLSPGMNLLIPLFSVALICVLKAHEHRMNAIYVWLLLAAAAAMGNLATGLQAADVVAVGLVFFAGSCIVAGLYIARLQAQSSPPARLVIVIMVTLVLAFLGVQAQQELISSFKGSNWIGFHSLFLFSNIAGGIFILLLLISVAYYPVRITRQRAGIGFPLLALLVLAMLSPIWELVFPYKMLTEATRSAAEIFEELNSAIPIISPNPQDRQLLTYYQANLPSSGAQDDDFHIEGWETAEMVEDGYVLVREGILQVVPEKWVRIDSFGWLSAPTRLVLYRSLGQEAATVELQAASILVDGAPTSESYHRLYEALINAGDHCRAYEAWMVSKELGGGPSDSIPIRADIGCFNQSEGGGLEENLADQALPVYGGYIVKARAGEAEDGAPIWQVRRRYAFYYDPRIFDLSLRLSPDAFYLYSVSVRGRGHEPFYTLYWRIGDTEAYLNKKSYLEWERISLLIYSGGEADGEIELRNSPVLVDNFGLVLLRGVELRQISH